MDQLWVFQEHTDMRDDAVAEPRNCRICLLLAAEERAAGREVWLSVCLPQQHRNGGFVSVEGTVRLT